MKRTNWERIFSSVGVFIVIVVLSSNLQAQTIIYTKDNMHELPTHVTSDTKISEMKYETKLLGTNYLNEAWTPTEISMAGDSIILQDVDARLDISNGVIEIRSGDKIMVIPSYKTKSVLIKTTNELYLSRTGLNLYGPTGYYKVLYKDRSALYCHYSTKVKESNYNVALDAGRMDDEIIMVQTYYLVKGGKLLKLEKKKNKLAEQLGGTKVMNFIKENSIDIKDESGLVAIIQFLDGKK